MTAHDKGVAPIFCISCKEKDKQGDGLFFYNKITHYLIAMCEECLNEYQQQIEKMTYGIILNHEKRKKEIKQNE